MFICSGREKRQGSEIFIQFPTCMGGKLLHLIHQFSSIRKRTKQNTHHLFSVYLLQRGIRNIQVKITYFSISSHCCTNENKRNSFSARTHHPKRDSSTWQHTNLITKTVFAREGRCASPPLPAAVPGPPKHPVPAWAPSKGDRGAHTGVTCQVLPASQGAANGHSKADCCNSLESRHGFLKTSLHDKQQWLKATKVLLFYAHFVIYLF